MASSESQARLTQTETAKWIVVYKNGDQHFAGRRMVVKPREIRTFDHLLEEVTVKLSPSFGAVRNIFTPEGGTRVSSLTDLKPNGKYVASPNEPFRQLSRTRYGEVPAQSTSSSQSHVSLQPVKDKQVGATGGGRRLHTVPSRYRESGSDELTIHVYRNGDAFSAASPLRVDRLARTHWQQTLQRLGEKLRIGRSVDKLYNLRGQLVRNPATELKHNGLYVAAADNENFRLVNYGAAREPFKSATRGDSRSSTPHLPCAHQRVTESAPSIGTGASVPRLAAPQSSSWPQVARRGAPLPPLRVSYPQLAHRRSHLKDKIGKRGQKAKEGEPAPEESDRKYKSLHQPPKVQPQLPRPPPRGVVVAPIDVAPCALPAADSDMSAFSSSTDIEDGSLMNVLSPDFSEQDVYSRPEPFYLHPLPESGEEGSDGHGSGRSWELDHMERRLGSALTAADADTGSWPDEGHGPEQDFYIVTDPLAAPLSADLAASYSAPHLSRPPSPSDSGEGTPQPTDPRLARSHLGRPRGSGFYSAGYSPLPEPRGHTRSDTPCTPPFGAVLTTERSSGRLAVGGGSRTASRAASEPRLDSRLSSETPEPSACEMMLISDGSGEFRCVSVLSLASSVPSSVPVAVSPSSPELTPPLMYRPASRGTLRAPVSGGESPAAPSSGSTTPVSAWSDAADEPASEAEDGIPCRSARSRLSSPETVRGQPSSPPAVPPEELSSPGELTEQHVSPSAASRDGLPSCSKEDASPPTDLQLCPVASRDSSVPSASCRHSPVTPELRRPLLARPVPRDLVSPHGEPSAPAAVSDVSAVSGSARSVPAAQNQPSGPALSPPEVMAVEQIPDWSAHPAHSQPAVIADGQSVPPDEPLPPPPPVSSPPVSPPSAPADERPVSLAESKSPGEEPVTTASRASSNAKALLSPSAPSQERQRQPPSASPTELQLSGSPPVSAGERGGQSIPASVSLAERARSRPVPSPRRRRSVSEGSPLSWSGTAGSTGWLWDEIPARPSDREIIAKSKHSVEDSQQSTSPPLKLSELSEMSELLSQLTKLPNQPVWPPTRTHTPEQADEPAPEPERNSGPAKPEMVPETGSELSAAPGPTAPLPERGAEPAAAAGERGTEAATANIGQKLDEIASLLRTLLLQNVVAGRADGGGGGAAPPLSGLSEEQLRVLQQPDVEDPAATGDSPPHKPR